MQTDQVEQFLDTSRAVVEAGLGDGEAEVVAGRAARVEARLEHRPDCALRGGQVAIAVAADRRRAGAGVGEADEYAMLVVLPDPLAPRKAVTRLGRATAVKSSSAATGRSAW